MSEDQPVLIRLRRNQSGTQWGFRMHGGRDQGSCLYIQKITNKSISHRNGLRVGDGIIRINNTPAQYLNHEQAKMEIIRSGNELDLLIQRNAVDLGQCQVDGPTPKSVVDEEPSQYKGYTNPNVQSRSFKILQESLQYSEASDAPN